MAVNFPILGACAAGCCFAPPMGFDFHTRQINVISFWSGDTGNWPAGLPDNVDTLYLVTTNVETNYDEAGAFKSSVTLVTTTIKGTLTTLSHTTTSGDFSGPPPDPEFWPDWVSLDNSLTHQKATRNDEDGVLRQRSETTWSDPFTWEDAIAFHHALGAPGDASGVPWDDADYYAPDDGGNFVLTHHPGAAISNGASYLELYNGHSGEITRMYGDLATNTSFWSYIYNSLTGPSWGTDCVRHCLLGHGPDTVFTFGAPSVSGQAVLFTNDAHDGVNSPCDGSPDTLCP